MSKARDFVENMRGVSSNIQSQFSVTSKLDVAETRTANQSHGDNVKAKFGASDDLQIYHDGSNSYISDTTGGNFFINDDGAGYLTMKGSDLYFRNPSSDDMIHATSGGHVKLYYNGVEKLVTTDSGVDVTGLFHIDSGARDEVLRIEGSGSPYASFYDSGVRQAYIGSFGTVFYIAADTPDTQVKIATGGVTRITFDASGLDVTGSITASGTVDGRDVAVDGSKLDGIATSANNYTHPANHAISVITGLQTALDSKLPLAGGTMAGLVNMSDNIIQSPEIKDYSETVQAMAANDVDCTLGNVQTKSIAGSVTLTFSNPPVSGKAGSFTLIATLSATPVITWPATVKWAGGTAPTLTAAGIDVFSFMTTDAGTNWLGFTAGQEMS